MHILVVEDDVQLARLVSSALIKAGHDPIIVHNGERALDKAKETRFDLIVLDIILPRMDGFDVLRHLRSQHMASRVLMLTARGKVKDRVTGLRLFAKAICHARTGGSRECVGPTLPRRTSVKPSGWRSHTGSCQPASPSSSRRIELSARELMLLKVLMREPGRVFTRTELCERVWEHGHEYDTKLVEVLIGRLRKKIGDPPLIHTVRYVGYTAYE
jgi:DNA-binding response OmpR family regulator